MISDLEGILNSNDCTLFYRFIKFQDAHPVYIKQYDYDNQDACMNIDFNQSEWSVELRTKLISEGVIDLSVVYTLVKGACTETNVGLGLRFGNWSADNYVIMPAAVYNGNRFYSKKLEYPPILNDPEDLGIGKGVIITDVPRLNICKGHSRIQQITRDLSTPAIGFRSNVTGKGLWLLTVQGTVAGDSGIEIEEEYDRSVATIILSAPGVRHDYRYGICNMTHTCDDKGTDFKEGDILELKTRLYFFNCPEIQTLFNYFVNIRKDLTGSVQMRNTIPFYSAWNIQERKYNEQNWEEHLGYFSVGMRDNVHQDWQVGWVGGMIATYPLIYEGNSISRERSLRNFDFLFNGGQDKSGFFYGCGHKGKWYGDNFKNLTAKWHLLRKSADALYYLIKQFMIIEKLKLEKKPKSTWIEGTRRCADAFVTLWDKNKQFGQFVDSETGDIIIGGSAGAGIAPAGLALAWEYFGEEAYIRVASESALDFYEKFVKKGYTTGGPGEICQCPDSESAFGLLESFIVLYETTGEAGWLSMAKEQANQCFTWCVSYDFRFPKESTFGKLGMCTVGSVYANIQNKHSSPGICTLSGNSLFKLYRATGEIKYLELIKEMAHNMPQYLSRDDKPIPALSGNWAFEKPHEYYHKNMPAGWMNERVQMSDWLEPVGEVFWGSCWCEVSNMLVYAEIPGLYIQVDTGFLCVIDHVEVEVLEKTWDMVKVKIYNPTQYKASVKVFSEKSSDMEKPIGQNFLYGCIKVDLESMESKIMVFV